MYFQGYKYFKLLIYAIFKIPAQYNMSPIRQAVPHLGIAVYTSLSIFWK